MTRVGVNARALAKPDPAGVSRYTHNLLDALAGLDGPDVEYLLFGVESVPESLASHEAIASAGVPAPSPSGLRAHRWEQLTLPRALRRREVDVFHTPAGQPPLLADVPLVTTVHDLSPVAHPEWFSLPYAALYRVLTPLAVRASDRLVAVSAFTRDELADRYGVGEKTVAVHNGVTPPDASDATPVPDLSAGEFLLFVGAANPRKNLATVLDAYRRYRERVADPAALALVGPERSAFGDRDHDLADGVHALGYVADEELAWLYHEAAALVYPSLYEGFGLPILEAMSVGTPAVTSDRGAMAEVAGDAACLADPNDPADLAAAFERCLADGDALAARGRERAASFTWTRAAELTRDVYLEVARR